MVVWSVRETVGETKGAFSDLRRMRERVRGARQVLPSVFFWIATSYCAGAFEAVCPYSPPDGGAKWQCVAGRFLFPPPPSVSASTSRMSPSLTHLQLPRPLFFTQPHWLSLIVTKQSPLPIAHGSQHWSLWVWWLSTLPRLIPRFLRLTSYFKSMERNLVKIPLPITVACATRIYFLFSLASSFCTLFSLSPSLYLSLLLSPSLSLFVSLSFDLAL